MLRNFIIGIVGLIWIAGTESSLARAQQPDQEPLEVPSQVDVEEDYQYEYREEPVIREAVSEILSQDAFKRLRRDEPEKQESEEEEPDQPEEEGWAKRLSDWLDRRGREAEEDSGDSSAGIGFSLPGLNLLVYAMAAAILVAVVVLILRSISRSSKSLPAGLLETTTEFSTLLAPPGEQSPEEYWARALKYGEARQFKSAIREILLGAMSFIERKGLIRHRKGLTNRDYHWATRGGARDSFDSIAKNFDLVHFGRREATIEGFRECRQAFEKSFRREAQ